MLTVTDTGLYAMWSDNDCVSALAALSIDEHYAAERAAVPTVPCGSYRTVRGLYANPDVGTHSL